MATHCCRCWRCVDDDHDAEMCVDCSNETSSHCRRCVKQLGEYEIHICTECTLQELEIRTAWKGFAFQSLNDVQNKDGDISPK